MQSITIRSRARRKFCPIGYAEAEWRLLAVEDGGEGCSVGEQVERCGAGRMFDSAFAAFDLDQQPRFGAVAVAPDHQVWAQTTWADCVRVLDCTIGRAAAETPRSCLVGEFESGTVSFVPFRRSEPANKPSRSSRHPSLASARMVRKVQMSSKRVGSSRDTSP